MDGRIVSIKALFDVDGEVTSAGSRTLCRRAKAEADAVAVARLRAAGAIIIGRTQMTEFAFSAVGTNPHDGTPGNPHDRLRAPGGSSSGAAVSVVVGLADIAIGSDTGGSLRIPAALCGAVGFKPTQSRVSRTGVFPLSTTLDTIGPIARNVADCIRADAVISDSGLPEPRRSAAPRSFRLIVARGRPFAAAEAGVLAALEAAIERLRAGGLTVVDGSLDAVLDRIAEIDHLGAFPPVELAATLASLGVRDLATVDPMTRARIEAGAGQSAVAYVRMGQLRKAAVQDFAGAMQDGDVFVLPTTPIRAPLLSALQEPAVLHATNALLLRNPRIANLLDCPSISLPVRATDLPVGLMLMGRRHCDQRLLAIAACIEEILLGG